MSALRSLRILDPLASLVLFKEAQRIRERKMATWRKRKYTEPGYAADSKSPWNDMRAKLTLHLCESVKKFLEKR